MNKFEGFLYDLFGGLIFVIVLFGTLFCCSDTVHSFTTSSIDKFFFNEDTVSVSNGYKKVQKNDSVVTIKKDTITESQMNDAPSVDTIPLKKGKDDLYYLSTFVNGIPMKFALDTGCSGMSISAVEYLFLEHQGLVKENTNKECVSTMANGQEEKGFVTTLDSIRIGNKTIKNVICNVSPNQDASLLLGQEVLSKLGDTTIKYNQEILLIEKND